MKQKGFPKWAPIIPTSLIVVGLTRLIFEPLFRVIGAFIPLVALGLAIGLVIWRLPAERLQALLANKLVRGLLIGLGLAIFYVSLGWLGYTNLNTLAEFMGVSALMAAVILSVVALMLVPLPTTIITLFKPAGIPINTKSVTIGSRGLAVVLITILLVRGFTVEGWEVPVLSAASISEAAAGPARYRPPAVRPVIYSRECVEIGPRLNPSRAAKDSVQAEGNGVWTIWWTGERLFNLLNRSQYQWPEEVEEVRIRVTHLNGHLDSGNGATHPNRHFFAEVTRPRDYHRWTYCPVPYGLPHFMPYLGPGQIALLIDYSDPQKGLYPFADFNGDLSGITIRRGEQPVLFYNNHSPANGRRHRAVFRLTITPV